MSETGDDRGADAGATLLEVLVVVAILGLTAGIGFPRLQDLHSRLAAQAARDQVAADLRSARALAIRSGRPVAVEITDQGRTLSWEQRRDRLPDAFRLTTDPPILSFGPDGSTTGARLELASYGRAWPGLLLRPETGAIDYAR